MRAIAITLLTLWVGCVDEAAHSGPEPEVAQPAQPPPRAAQGPGRSTATRVDEASRIDPSWDDAEEVRELATRCDSGVNRDCWLLGVAYELHDVPRASVLYRRACREGARGCVEAARTHPSQAAQHLALGCRHGAGPACRKWAELEDISESDRDEARSLGCRSGWLEACDEPLPGCGGSAAVCVRRAREALAREDHRAALRLGRLTCDGEQASGCEVFARASMDEDPSAAEVALERACRAEDAIACRALAAIDGEHQAIFGRVAAALERR